MQERFTFPALPGEAPSAPTPRSGRRRGFGRVRGLGLVYATGERLQLKIALFS